jgi:hypothetical protein
MQTFLLVRLSWITPSFLFVGWRLWMSRPLRDVHYRHRWQYSHALTGPLKTSMIHFSRSLKAQTTKHKRPPEGGLCIRYVGFDQAAVSAIVLLRERR